MEDASITGRLAIFQEIFCKWYLEMKAPQFVKLTEPWSMYPKARALRRRIIFHAGPTNSGKTHASLECLVKARTGIYCAPLKALASQVWTRINQQVPCDLIIGDERVFPGFAEHVSCTMEMTPLNEMVDVAVIDEIQLIEDKDRGWAWTRALLGVPAREVHLCGEFRALRLVEHLLYATREWERLEIIEHKRMVPLRLESDALTGLQGLSRGDCLVAFSRANVFKFKQQVEEAYPTATVNVVYGGLPFAVRQAECDAYNTGIERGDFHILVATDAIAYGLNMSIRRIIFTTLRKFNGKEMALLSSSQILQIAGRAGRYGLSFADSGYVTSCHPDYTAHIRNAFRSSLPSIRTAGVLPSIEILCVYADMHPEIPNFYMLLCQYVREVSTSKYFHVCDISRSLLPIARTLQGIPLALNDIAIFCFAPLSAPGGESYKVLRRWAENHAKPPHRVVMGTELASRPLPTELPALEWRFKMIETYGWLAWRFQKTFVELEEAKLLKEEIVSAMKAVLAPGMKRSVPSHGDVHVTSAVPLNDPSEADLQERLMRRRPEAI